MTPPYLPDDCIFYILQFIQNHGSSTLFNCLLVNRFWCKATIPLLYANPFDIANNYTIILTLILCFRKTKILQLKNQLIDINDIDEYIEYKPLFEYTNYVVTYNYVTVNKIIHKWFGNLKLPFDQLEVIPIIHQLILLQCNNIKQLIVESSLFDNKKCNIHFIKNFASNLSKSNSRHEIVLEFLNNVENICLNLRELKIYSLNMNTIIQKMNQLKVFKISKCAECNHLLNDILTSLEFQKQSLAYIEFEKISLNGNSLKNFKNLCNLKYLKFSHCEMPLDQCEILRIASFKLKGLSFQCNDWNYDITSLIIKYLGASLQRLSISTQELIISTTENILVYCSNLVTLEITINSADVNLLIFPYFKNLKIRRLNFIFALDYDGNEVYAKIAINVPTTIKEVSIHFDLCFFKNSHFVKFLRNCHDYLEVINLDCINLKILKEILNYTERNNRLKIVGIYIELETKWSDDENNLLAKIKDKGVEVKFIEFNSF